MERVSTPQQRSIPRWLDTPRRWLGVVAAAALLYLLLPGFAFPLGYERPFVLAAVNDGQITAAVLTAVILILATPLVGLLGAAIRGRTSVDGVLFVSAAAVSIVVWFYGDLDDWLIFFHSEPGKPSGTAYFPLVFDQIVLAVVFAASILTGAMLHPRGPSLRETLHLSSLRSDLPNALGAGVITLVVAAIVSWILSGPNVLQIYHFQNYFAVGVGFAAGAAAARYVLGRRHPLILWCTPILLSVIGVAVAMVAPTIGVPEAYAHLDTSPAWRLVRPLPAETIAVGLLALQWSGAADLSRYAEERRS